MARAWVGLLCLGSLACSHDAVPGALPPLSPEYRADATDSDSAQAGDSEAPPDVADPVDEDAGALQPADDAGPADVGGRPDGYSTDPGGDPAPSGALSDTTLGDLNGVWVSDSGVVWVAGADGRLSRWTEEAWQTVGTSEQALHGVHGRGEAAWAVGAGGVVLRGDSIEPTPSTSRLRAAWFASGSVFTGFAVGDDGTVLASLSEGEWFEMVVFRGGGEAEGVIRDVWGADEDDAWAVGDAGLLVRYNGKHWGEETPPNAGDLIGVMGAGGQDLWVIAADGSIHRRVQDEWSSYEAAIPGVAAITGPSGVPYVVGAAGNAWRFPGKALSWSPIESGTVAHLFDVYEGQPAYAVGAMGTVVALPQ